MAQVWQGGDTYYSSTDEYLHLVLVAKGKPEAWCGAAISPKETKQGRFTSSRTGEDEGFCPHCRIEWDSKGYPIYVEDSVLRALKKEQLRSTCHRELANFGVPESESTTSMAGMYCIVRDFGGRKYQSDCLIRIANYQFEFLWRWLSDLLSDTRRASLVFIGFGVQMLSRKKDNNKRRIVRRLSKYCDELGLWRDEEDKNTGRKKRFRKLEL